MHLLLKRENNFSSIYSSEWGGGSAKLIGRYLICCPCVVDDGGGVVQDECLTWIDVHKGCAIVSSCCLFESRKGLHNVRSLMEGQNYPQPCSDRIVNGGFCAGC